MGVTLIRAERQKDGQTMTKVIRAFRKYANAPKRSAYMRSLR
jgi:hypothetical protein